jgi:hypothetical protein
VVDVAITLGYSRVSRDWWHRPFRCEAFQNLPPKVLQFRKRMGQRFPLSPPGLDDIETRPPIVVM